MTAIATTIAKQNVCPNIIVDNTTVYPPNTSHAITNFNTLVRVIINLPSGNIAYSYPTGSSFFVATPDVDTQVSYETCLVGKFSLTYIALPTPPDLPVAGQSNQYTIGDNFYYDGVIYDVVANFFGIPVINQLNSAIITAALASGAIIAIEQDTINAKYKATEVFTHWCKLDTCLKAKLEKLNCLIVKEPTRNDLCEMELYEQVLQLNHAKYYVDASEYLIPPYQSTPEKDYMVEKVSNYVNSICCCKNCDC